MEQTIIYLNAVDAQKFIEFQKNYELFKQLSESGAFQMAFGKVTINIAFNEVQNIVKEEVVFRKK